MFLSKTLRTKIATRGATTVARRAFSTPVEPLRILVTGSGGQVGADLVTALRAKYGGDAVLATDVRRPSAASTIPGPFQYLDVMDKPAITKAVVEHDANCVVHLASILSAAGEQNPALAMNLNSRSIENILEIARTHKLRVLAPSTIAVFGASTPRVMTPDETVMRPSTMYGVTKVYLELLGEYYHSKFGVDFRSMRYPGIISNTAMPGGGTTDYAVDIYHQAILHGRYSCFLESNSEMPMMYSPDSTKAAMDLLAAPRERLTQCVYNVTGFSFTPAQIAASIKARIPHFEVSYAPDFRQAIANSWPASLDDSAARADWGWEPSFSVEAMTDDMLTVLRAKYGVKAGTEGKTVTQTL